ncbi:hypothetical protein GQ44DRAFT_710174 [Phaeosphaeriaceae sp. PMI808]|nr:hypothetical protein GQ44DRAFT_710174 [Phaeosphaeriaceae sp. PMI808]
MADEGNRIPAWRRLGLALRNELQSGVTAPEPITSQSNLQNDAPYGEHGDSQDNIQSPVKPTLAGKSSKLGKRKHQHDEPAEQEVQTPKKCKPSTAHVNSNETPFTDSPLISQSNNAKVQTSWSEPSTSEAKGDPNYRKKKAKPNKRRNYEDSQVNHTQPALSPDIVLSEQEQPTLLASTETTHQVLAPTATPQRQRETSRGSNKDPSGSPSGIDRRKSVTFTPDTKRVDGNSAQNLFKKWVAEQKGLHTETSARKIEDQVPRSTGSGEGTKAEKVEAQQKKETKKIDSASNKKTPTKTAHDQPATTNPTPGSPKGKKKDPSIYISYLTQYHTNRDQWKFNKAKQNDVIDNALNIFRIPEDHSEALLEYVQGLKGAGIIDRLRSRCEATLKDMKDQDAKDPSMDDSAARQAIQDEALQVRIAKERKRRKVEGDVENLLDHPHSDGYIRRMQRSRAEALLGALGRTAPILPATNTNGINPMLKHVAPVRDSKKRKRRGGVSSDESSEESSSDEDSSSSESGSDDSCDSSTSDSDSVSNAGTDSDSESSSNASASSGDSESDSESGSDSDTGSN